MEPTRTIEKTPAEKEAARIGSGPVVVEVRGVDKIFRIPDNRVDSIKERAVHPFRRNSYRELKALNDISFDVHQGEFFGIVGLNGSGKSTLLKILGSIYRADGGRIRTAGRIAPFIELGVGFNPEMTAHENIVLNAVMMGLSRQDAQSRVRAAIDFAGLDDFAELKLKNYSSGMLVRLAFSVMVQAEADIMLIDEVLAVGDASFQQKCEDVFHDMRSAGKTIVLVTHDMNAVEKFCHRAMMIHNGKMSIIGSPGEVSDWYLRANFREEDERPGFHAGASEEGDDAHVVEGWLEDMDGTRIANVEQGQQFRMNLVVEAIREIEKPLFSFIASDQVGLHVFSFNKRLSESPELPDSMAPGERVQVSVPVENLLQPGHYYVSARGFRNENINEMNMQMLRVIDFVVFGTETGPGVVSLTGEVEVSRPGAGD
ncbi:MAG: ABC transporter ATP-binding protein [Solirubrobacterales bacterium]|nr:ABC transporter ATP-binding protein [Solirubrobacterales bacterium]